MRHSGPIKSLLLALFVVGAVVLLLSSTLTGCTKLRTPYELEKMKQAGGKDEKKGGDGQPA